jgi:hypothetical protein
MVGPLGVRDLMRRTLPPLVTTVTITDLERVVVIVVTVANEFGDAILRE